jgi:fluoroquinolone resistance protein
MKGPTDLMKRFEGAGLPAISLDQLKPHSDLTFKVFDNLTVVDTDIHQSLLNGCLVRNCTFRQVRFSRCDLEQVQFQNCRFVEVDFVNVELTSTQIDQSQFKNCNFESALISESVWRQCALESCSFKQAVIHNCLFEHCRLKDNDLQGASIQLDTFRQSAFESMKLGDCTFLNHILNQCSYKNVSINAESIGSLFGISEEDLLSFRLVYLGHSVVDVAGAKGLLDSLETDYEQRHWFFMCEILRLNFRRTPRSIALDACLKAVLWPASLGAPLKAGDITFLEMIVLELFRLRELPALTALTFPELIRSFRHQITAENLGRSDSLKLQQLAGRLQGILLELLEHLKSATERLMVRDKSVTATLVFSEKPASDVVKFLRTLGEASGLRIRGSTRMLREESGSYLLILKTTLVTLAALQTALWLLNGCAAQIIELKTRLRVAAQKHPPKIIRDRVLLPDQHLPKWMAVTIQSIFAKLTADPTSLHQIASEFGPQNLQNIEIGERRPRNRPHAVVGKS